MTGIRKGKRTTEREREAGQQNLENWLMDHPERGNLRHGAYSKHIHKRYSDNRYKEAKWLRGVMNELVEDLGGQSELTSPQCLLLSNVRTKLIILHQIGAFIDIQESIITKEGELLPCLGKSYVTYTEALRRDLEALFHVKRQSAHLSYDKALKVLEGGKKGKPD